MKKLTLQIVLLLCATTLFAQWVPINNGLNDFPPTALLIDEDNVDNIILGTYGGGVYLSTDQGDNWTTFNGDLPNLYVNDVRSHIGLLVATEGGPFATYDGANYFDCTGTGLTNTDINFFSFGNEGITGEFMVGTNGGGVFAGDHTSPWILDWTAASTGLTGNGLIVNDGAGANGGMALIATDGGVYRAMPGETEWTAINTGLSGDALKVQRIFGMTEAFIMIATHGGLYSTSDLGDSWVPVIPDEKLNTVFIHMSDIYPNEIVLYAFGENGFYTDDFETWTQMDFEGIEGEVTAAQADSTNLYLGFTINEKDGKETGGVYRKPLEQIITGIENHTASTGAVLHQNFPNPFKQNTSICYHLSQPGFVCLKVYDYMGKEVKTLIDVEQGIGNYNQIFYVENLPAGMYFYKLKVENQKAITKRMVITN